MNKLSLLESSVNLSFAADNVSNVDEKMEPGKSWVLRVSHYSWSYCWLPLHNHNLRGNFAKLVYCSAGMNADTLSLGTSENSNVQLRTRPNCKA